MRNYFIVFAFSLISFFSKAQIKNIVFESGKEGYSNYRIPAVCRLANGEILAICEARKNNAGDFGDIDIVMKKSANNGKTWSPLTIVVDNGILQAGNPAPVVDLTDPKYPKGRIFLFYNTGNTNESAIRNGKGVREVWFITSIDNGKTWSIPHNITTSVHKPNFPGFDSSYSFGEDWRSYANTPGHGLQFLWGRYKGRIYIAANHSAGNPQAHFKDYQVHGYYTDDHGASFHLSQNISFKGGNEAMAAQLSKDTLMVNARNQQGNVKSRIVALSSDGGNSWFNTRYDRHLPDPICQGSILSFKDKKGRVLLVACNNADSSSRNMLTLRVSKDNGRSWYFNKVIAEAKNVSPNDDYSGYSDIVNLNNQEIGVLYELDNYKKIVFASVKMD